MRSDAQPGSVGVLAFVFARHINRLRCDVESVIGVANNLIKLVLAPPGRRRLAYEAGQFVFMALFDPSLSAGYGKKHPDTLFSSHEGQTADCDQGTGQCQLRNPNHPPGKTCDH